MTLRLHQALWQKLEAVPSLVTVLKDIEMPLVPVLARIERNGALVDGKLLGQQSLELGEKMVALERQAYELAGQEFNLGSPKQLGAILYEKLGLPVLAKTATGQPSTAENVLADLAEQDFELPKVIMQYRSLSKLKSTYTDKLPEQINPRTGRIHTSYHQAVAATGRLSSSDPNLQNIPIRTAEGGASVRPSSHPRATSCWRRTIRRSSCASWPTWPRTKACWMPSVTTATCTGRRRRRSSASSWTRSAMTSAAAPRPSTSASSTA